jgi:pyruvate dehydrogenase E2 component (dihydrolipoamide acetyltransferase)
MLTEIRLPKFADEMNAATVVRWLKTVGEPVIKGEVIAEIETEKAGVDLEAPGSGILASILVAEGTEDVHVGAVLATIETTPDHEYVTSEESKIRSPRTLDVSPQMPTNQTQDSHVSVECSGQAGHVQRSIQSSSQARSSDFNAGIIAQDSGQDRPLSVTPLAGMMAEIAGLDLSSVTSGAGAALTRQDIEEALRSHNKLKTQNQPKDDEKLCPQIIPHNAIRKRTAERTTEAKQKIPHFYLSVECDMVRAVSLLEELNRKRPPHRLTVTTLIVKTAAAALVRVPSLNAEYTPTHLVMREVNIAVGIAAPSGLVAPVIKKVNKKMLLRIAEELQDLVQRAKTARLRLEDTMGASFTVSNLGMFGVTKVVPIITPGQSGVLGIGATREIATIRNGAVVVGKEMTATLSGDHRALDGAQGAEFLQIFKELIEEPVQLIL